MNKSTWNTYAVYGYTFQAGTDPRATGGVHLHQVRKGKAGWMRRVVDSNGRYQSAGRAVPISEADGEANYATAKSR